MSQTEREYRDALDALRFSDEAKERMMKNLMEQKEQEPVKRRSIRPLRMALIAAAACLVLLGTASAALSDIWAPPRLEAHIDGSGRFDGYTVLGKLATYPISQFSDAFLEAGEDKPNGMVAREFSTFDGVQAYLGEYIPCSWAKDWDGSYTVQLYHDEQQKIWGSEVVSESQDGRVDIRMLVLTENSSRGEEQGPLVGGGPDAVMEQLPSYQMPNGCVAESFTIVRTEVEGWDYSTCISFFIKDGNMYEVSVDGELEDPASLWPEVQAVLDSFE